MGWPSLDRVLSRTPRLAYVLIVRVLITRNLLYLSHHMAKIVTAAVFADAEHIADGIIGLKQRALELALADGAAGAAAA